MTTSSWRRYKSDPSASVSTVRTLNTGLLSECLCFFMWNSRFASRQLSFENICDWGVLCKTFFSVFLLHKLEFMGLFLPEVLSNFCQYSNISERADLFVNTLLSSLQIRKHFRNISKFQVLWGKTNFISNIRFQSLQFNFEEKFYLKERINNPHRNHIFLADSAGFDLLHRGSSSSEYFCGLVIVC